MEKDIKIDTVENLLKLKESFNKTFDKNIEIVKLNEKISSIDDLTFGQIKQFLDCLSTELFDTDKGKSVIKKYVKIIRENKSLKEAHQLYCQINKIPQGINDSSLLSLFEKVLSKIDKKQYKDGKRKLSNLIKEGILLTSISSEDFDKVLNENKTLNESFEYLFTHNIKAKNIVEGYNNIKTISQFINENKLNESNSIEKTTLEKDEAYSGINNILSESEEEWEKETMIDVALSMLSGKENKELFEEYKRKCISTIDEISNGANISEKSQMELMKEQISKKVYNPNTFNDDILKFSELNYTIKNQE